MRRLVWVEPQVRPSSQRGASIARVERRAVSHVPGEQRGLRLRLAIAAHGAIGDDAAVREHRERRIERVERQPAGRERIQRARFERKAGAAILHQYAGRGQHDARAEFPIERLDVGNDEPGRVGGAHPHRVAFTIRGRPVRGLAAIDLERLAVEKPAVEDSGRPAAGCDRDRSRRGRARAKARLVASIRPCT